MNKGMLTRSDTDSCYGKGAKILRMTIRAALWALVLGYGGSVYAAPGDDDFLAMRDAFRVGDTRKLDLYAPKLKGHVLEPYAAYWQLRPRLNDAAPETVRAFLAEYKDTLSPSACAATG
jgi:hypothetical protein